LANKSIIGLVNAFSQWVVKSWSN